MDNNSNKNEVANVTDFSTYAEQKKKEKEKVKDATPVYVYEGRKNVTEFPRFIELCKATQEELKELLPDKLVEAGYTDIVIGDGYIYATGDIPILLTAHMDTVHVSTVKDYYEAIKDGKHVISSPQGIGGDDRCGIFIILEIIKNYKPFILFCEDEEKGGDGSDKFCETDLIAELEEMNFLIELDRMNNKDAVFYDCDNPEFTKFITETTGYKEAWGTFSDISTLAPACGVAAVNLSCGYYNAHRLTEYVVVEEMYETLEVVKKLLDVGVEQFEYIEKKSYYGKGYSGYGSYRYDGGWYDDDYYDYGGYGGGYSNGYDKGGNTTKSYSYSYERIIFVTFKTDNGEIQTLQYTGETKELCLLAFLNANPTVRWGDVLDYEYDWV